MDTLQSLLREGACPLLARLSQGCTQNPPAGVCAVWDPCSPPLRNLLLSPVLLRALLEQPIAQKCSRLAQPHASVGRRAWMRCSPQTLPLKFLPTVGSCCPRVQGARAAGPWVPRAHLEGRARNRWPEPERAECQTAGRPAGKREQGQLKPRNQLDRRRRVPGRERGKGDEMRDESEALGGMG